MNPTPETLRNHGIDLNRYGENEGDEWIAAADAWEAQQKEWAKHYETDTNTILDLRQRLEAAVELCRSVEDTVNSRDFSRKIAALAAGESEGA